LTGNLPSIYDLIIDINSIRFLHKKGWWVKVAKDFQWKKLDEQQGRIACVLGNFNKGKSWLLSQLSGKTFSQGFDLSTVGLSILHDK